MPATAFALAFVLAAGAPAAAQTVLHRFYGTQFSHYGEDVAAAGDVDLDGRPDYLVGAPTRDWVDVRSGSDGRILHRIAIDPGMSTDWFGTWVAGQGEVNGDGVPDVAIAHRFDPAGSSIKVYSGADATLLLTFRPGVPVFGQSPNALDFVGDVDRDGADELLLGLDGAGEFGDDRGQVWLISGADARVLYTDAGDFPLDRLGFTVAGLGDVDGDTWPDFAYVKRFDDDPAEAVGLLRVVSGRTLGVLWERVGLGFPTLGLSIAGLGDTNGDGVPDVAVVSPQNLFVLSGDDGALRWSRPVGGGIESPVAGGSDIDADGYPDVIVGDSNGDPGHQGWVKLYSGIDGDRIDVVFGPDRITPEFGAAVALIEDVNGDGYGEFLVGGPDQHYLSLPLFGAATLFAGNPSPFGVLGGGVGGALGVPQLQASGTPEPGQDVSIELTGAPPASAVWLVVSDAQASLPFKGGTLVPSATLVIGSLVTNLSGNWAATARWPDLAAPGFTLWMQAWIADPTAPENVAASNALSATTP